MWAAASHILCRSNTASLHVWDECVPLFFQLSVIGFTASLCRVLIVVLFFLQRRNTRLNTDYVNVKSLSYSSLSLFFVFILCSQFTDGLYAWWGRQVCSPCFKFYGRGGSHSVQYNLMQIGVCLGNGPDRITSLPLCCLNEVYEQCSRRHVWWEIARLAEFISTSANQLRVYRGQRSPGQYMSTCVLCRDRGVI